jgi:hypothetical protein
MTDGDSVAQLAVVVLLLILAVPTLATAYDLAGTPFEYTETATVDDANPYEVSQPATQERYGETVTIVVDNTTLVAGEDYTWNATSGVVTWADSTNAPTGSEATIDYRAYQRTAETEMAWDVTAPLMGLFGLFGLVAAVRTLWSYIAEVWTL